MKEVIAKNRKARYNYHIDKTYIAGMRLKGTEVKSLRNHEASIGESYCIFVDGELFVRGMHINAYEFGSYNNHEEVIDRKLLLTKQELNKLKRKIEEKGYSIVPLEVSFIDGWIKMEIGIGKGKKNYDKRNDTKDKDNERESRRFK